MALEEEPSGAGHELHRAIEWLRDCTDLAGVDPIALEALGASAVHFSLPAGHLLFEAGSDPDGVYLLASGRLGVKTPSRSGLTAEIERGELVGEAGWLLGTQRSATVIALRDSELLLVPNAALDRIAARSTHFSLALARLCARRLRHSNTSAYNRSARTYLPSYRTASKSMWLISPLASSMSWARPAAPNWCGMRAPPRIRRRGSIRSRN
jgi:CRP-like cAMP-binding protein